MIMMIFLILNCKIILNKILIQKLKRKMQEQFFEKLKIYLKQLNNRIKVLLLEDL